MTKAVNPVLLSDFPDPDVICVDDVFYMASTTMHFMPGCVILKSYDLAHWEIVTHVYDVLEDYDAARLENSKSIYGSGMWAPTLRFANGKFYVLFIANDTHKTYLYSAEKIEGPWIKKEVEGFYYDASLLFDDDGKVYIFHGNREIFVTELEADLSRPKAGGVNKKILSDKCEGLGYEGSHAYKINGRYYLFNIHWPAGSIRTESCFTAEKIDGEWTGKDVVCNDMNFHRQGVAQGGIVQDAAGNWYGILFQDRGACGRMPVLCRVEWKNNFPVFGDEGNIPDSLCYEISGGCRNVVHAPSAGNDNFSGEKKYAADDGIRFAEGKETDLSFAEENKNPLKECWEWNHIPDNKNWAIANNCLKIRTAAVVPNMTRTRNTLTQRLCGCKNETIVTIDAGKLNDGDYAGLCAFQSCYAFAGLKRAGGQLYVVSAEKQYGPAGRKENRVDLEKAVETECIPWNKGTVTVKMATDFTDMKDEVQFYYEKEDKTWVQIGTKHKLYFMLDFFTGCRAGLFVYSTEKAGGEACFREFRNGICEG